MSFHQTVNLLEKIKISGATTPYLLVWIFSSPVAVLHLYSKAAGPAVPLWLILMFEARGEEIIFSMPSQNLKNLAVLFFVPHVDHKCARDWRSSLTRTRLDGLMSTTANRMFHFHLHRRSEVTRLLVRANKKGPVRHQ